MRTVAKNRARALRRQMTDAEALLWRHLRSRQLGESQFRRQHPIGQYYADFACVEKKLVIEVDGGQHAANEDSDKRRSEYLAARGYRVLRFWDHDVLTDVETVLETILSSLCGGTPSPCPSPLEGRRAG